MEHALLQSFCIYNFSCVIVLLNLVSDYMHLTLVELHNITQKHNTYQSFLSNTAQLDNVKVWQSNTKFTQTNLLVLVAMLVALCLPQRHELGAQFVALWCWAQGTCNPTSSFPSHYANHARRFLERWIFPQWQQGHRHPQPNPPCPN